MHIFKKFNYNLPSFLNFLICIMPLGLILGNLATNFLVISIGLLGIINYKKKAFIIENKVFQFLIYFFFLYLILITLLNNYEFVYQNEIKKNNLIKSFFFLRFLLLFLIINKLLENNELKIKYIFFSFAFFSLTVGLDLVFQYIFGKNILGYPLIHGIRATSFFQNELVAGGFLQRFSLFFIFFVLINLKNKKFSNLILIFLFLIFLIPMLTTLNRMPIIIFILSFCVYFFLENKIKEILSLFLIFIIVIFLFTNLSANKRIVYDIKNFLRETSLIVYHSPNLFIKNEINSKEKIHSDYLILFNSGVQLWKKNKLFGQGIKSFRVNCKKAKYETCSTHPHNYLIELLIDVGIVGVINIYLLIFLTMIKFLKYYIKENNIKSKLFSIPFFLLIFSEFFPLRSTGSFFTTSVAAYIFLILPILLNLNKTKIIK